MGNGLDRHAIVVSLKGRTQNRQLLMRLQSSEALVGLDHAGRAPSQRHTGIPPAFNVARDAANGAHHVLGDVGTGERSTKLLRQLQADDSQDFVEAFEDARRYTGPLLVGSTREIANQFFSLVGVIELAGLAQHPTGGRMMLLRQAFHDVARLVDLAALDRSGQTEGAADRLRQRFRAVVQFPSPSPGALVWIQCEGVSLGMCLGVFAREKPVRVQPRMRDFGSCHWLAEVELTR